MAWLYHPQEIVWRPAARSSLARSVARLLQETRPTAWVAHAADWSADPGTPDLLEARGHRIPPSEDGSRDGVECALVCNGTESAWSCQGHPDAVLQSTLLSSVDLAIVEGTARSDAPWVVELDSEGCGLERIPREERSRVIALVGTVPPRTDLPPGGIPRFAPQELPDLADHLLDHLEQQAKARPLLGWLLEDPMAPDDDAFQALTEACDRSWRTGAPPDQEGHLESAHPRWGDAGTLLTLMEGNPGCSIVVFDPRKSSAGRLETLLAERDGLAEASAYPAPDTHMPLPGCSVWEPRARRRLMGLLAQDVSCLRRTLVACRTHLLPR
ncbi:MAG: hypothetical protein H6686_12175 [Fibrobacteria bacterium]|nr:hypothetical protein [Fibrobacteria bacterium]